MALREASRRQLQAPKISGETALHVAAAKADITSVHRLLMDGADVDARNEYGDTPLHTAVGKAAQGVVELLLRYKADINAANNAGSTALHVAAYKSQWAIAEFLLDCGADINAATCSGKTALHAAVQGDLSILPALLVHRGANVRAEDILGNTALHFISRRRTAHGVRSLSTHTAASLAVTVFDVCSMLISRGASIDAVNDVLDTPLHCAIAHGNIAAAESLIQLGADVNLADAKGMLPLHKAAKAGDVLMTEVLTRYARADAINVKESPSDSTPLHRAVAADNSSVVKVLIERGADVNVKNQYNCKPLHAVAPRTDSATVILLLAAGADFHAVPWSADEDADEG